MSIKKAKCPKCNKDFYLDGDKVTRGMTVQFNIAEKKEHEKELQPYVGHYCMYCMFDTLPRIEFK